MAAPQQTGCYKCGALDHVATNRNCPRPRKPSAAITTATATAAAAPTLPSPALDRDAKFIKDARLGDDTRFWFYTDDDENEERSSSVEIIVKREEKSEVRGQQGEDAKNKWKMSDPVLKAAFAVKPGMTPVKKEMEKKQEKQQPVASQKKAVKKPEKKQNGVAKSVVRKKPVAKPVAKPRKPNTTANAAGASKQTKPPGNPAKATKPDQPQSSSPLTDPPPSPPKQEEPKSDRSGILGSFNSMFITQEYLDWCDRPENDPFARQNWKDLQFNNLGERNTISGFSRVRYQRNVQGWRECRSLGGGLGSPFP
ncbi:hypothetical protein K440DRAFT_641999 [Wilcoxina mikolae CBS 423.85]|nr:hypothetical protein K440DRAFT_641999 [Wilcoxina mikolae CBS 423.85]